MWRMTWEIDVPNSAALDSPRGSPIACIMKQTVGRKSSDLKSEKLVIVEQTEGIQARRA